MADGTGQRGHAVTFHITTERHSTGGSDRPRGSGTYTERPSSPVGFRPNKEGVRVADGSWQAQRIATLDELAMMASAISSAVTALQETIAAERCAESASDDGFPLAVWQAAAAEGALDVDDAITYRERRDDEREAMFDAEMGGDL